MTGVAPLGRVIGLSGGALDALMPMHVWIDHQGVVIQAGSTLQKMIGTGDLAGASVFELLEVRRPSTATTVPELLNFAGQRLGLVLKIAPDIHLRGALTGLPGQAGLILNVSLGLSFSRAVAEFDLNLNDFSPCDQTVELLYLYEANTSTMILSRKLSERLESARAEAEEKAMTDTLTGLANRRAMDLALQKGLDDPTEEFALLHIDLDLFKQVNDTYGHAAGDAVLERVGQILREDIRITDLAGRVGGDEFLVMLRDYSEATDAGAVAERLIEAIEDPVPFEGKTCRISASIGIAQSTDYATRPSLDGLLADTDMALYRAKREGRGGYTMHLDRPEVLPVSRRASDPVPRMTNPEGDAQKAG